MRSEDPADNFPQPGEAWLRAPDERSPDFFPAFARISVALRDRVPAAYFEKLENYRETKKAYPMLIYRSSRPFRARMRTELNYDVLNPAALARVFRSARQCLPELLTRTENLLSEAGCYDLTRYYQAKRTVEIIDSVQRLSKSRRCLYVLIRSESVLVNALIELGGLGALTARNQIKRTAAFKKRWSFQLRRLYPGTDFLSLAPALLESATQALVEFLNRPAASGDDSVPDNPGESAP
jgi:hypothetical protein